MRVGWLMCASARRDPAKLKYKFMLHVSGADAISNPFRAHINQQLDSLRRLLRSHTVVDRVHKHSSGVTEICFWLRPFSGPVIAGAHHESNDVGYQLHGTPNIVDVLVRLEAKLDATSALLGMSDGRKAACGQEVMAGNAHAAFRTEGCHVVPGLSLDLLEQRSEPYADDESISASGVSSPVPAATTMGQQNIWDDYESEQQRCQATVSFEVLSRAVPEFPTRSLVGSQYYVESWGRGVSGTDWAIATQGMGYSAVEPIPFPEVLAYFLPKFVTRVKELGFVTCHHLAGSWKIQVSWAPP